MSAVAKAFHLKYEEVKLDANVRKWDVQVLSVSVGGGKWGGEVSGGGRCI